MATFGLGGKIDTRRRIEMEPMEPGTPLEVFSNDPTDRRFLVLTYRGATGVVRKVRTRLRGCARMPLPVVVKIFSGRLTQGSNVATVIVQKRGTVFRWRRPCLRFEPGILLIRALFAGGLERSAKTLRRRRGAS